MWIAIRNINVLNMAIKSKTKSFIVDRSSLFVRLIAALHQDGFVDHYQLLENGKVIVFPKYRNGGRPVVRAFKVLSRPSRPQYVTKTKLSNLIRYKRPFLYYLSSSRGGIVSSRNSKDGGLLLLEVILLNIKKK